MTRAVLRRSLGPTGAPGGCRRDDHSTRLDANLDLVFETGLLEEGLGEADAAGVTDTDKSCLHDGLEGR